MSYVPMKVLAGVAWSLAAGAAFAAEDTLNAADTAWMMVATILVLFMTIPGIALFYAGMARKKNILSVLGQSLGICGLLTLLWVICGYSIAFDTGSAFTGGLSKVMLHGLDINTMSGSIPELLFVFFQMTFAVLTAALITGSWAGRMKFSAMMIFMVLWSLFVYAPVCHWVWGADGYFCQMGVLDYAGGTVVHINAGIAGLVGVYFLGPRRGFGRTPMAPSNLTLAVIGACMLWIGWMGFNGGSGLASDARAVMAMIVTQVAAAAGLVAWAGAEWVARGRPSVLGMISGAVAGLVAITPGSGFVEPGSALIIGLIAGVFCFWSATSMKRFFGYDDSFDAFGVHGMGGMLGCVLTAFFATSAVTGDALPDVWTQLFVQVASAVAVIVYCAAVSALILFVLKITIGLRVTPEEEQTGLDLTLHGERIE